MDLSLINVALDVQRSMSPEHALLFARALPNINDEINAGAVNEFMVRAYDDGSDDMLFAAEMVEAAIQLTPKGMQAILSGTSL